MKQEYNPHASWKQDELGDIALPAHATGSGTLDRLAGTALA